MFLRWVKEKKRKISFKGASRTCTKNCLCCCYHNSHTTIQQSNSGSVKCIWKSCFMASPFTSYEKMLISSNDSEDEFKKGLRVVHHANEFSSQTQRHRTCSLLVLCAMSSSSWWNLITFHRQPKPLSVRVTELNRFLLASNLWHSMPHTPDFNVLHDTEQFSVAKNENFSDDKRQKIIIQSH